MTKPVLVCYLCRKQDKDFIGKFKRFIDSYIKHPAGHEHDFVILRKGFSENDAEWEETANYANGLKYELRSCPDDHYPTGYVGDLLKQYSDRYFILFGAKVEITADNWLFLYMKHVGPKRLIGSHGSYMSFLLRGYDVNTKKFYGKFHLSPVFPPPKYVKPYQKMMIYRILKFFYRIGRSLFYTVVPDNFEGYGTEEKLMKRIPKGRKAELFHLYRKCFSTFPCVYLRGPGVLFPPHFLDDIYWPPSEYCNSKFVSYCFESSIYSISQQALMHGYELFVAGADGAAYPIDKFRESKTYYSYNEENQIICDYPDYKPLSERQKKLLELLVYGAKVDNLKALIKIPAPVEKSVIENFYKNLSKYRDDYFTGINSVYRVADRN